MKRRRWIVISAFLALAILVLFALVAFDNAHSYLEIRQIEKGMTQQQVEAILGPPSINATHQGVKDITHMWACNDGFCFVIYTDGVARTFGGMADSYWYETSFRRLRWGFGWRIGL
ncbi:MAG: outer membrane protein assembly factor BamE [Gemmataceae bacterium]